MLLVGTITLAPIGFVISGSFNVSDPGQPARLGLAGWQEVLLRSQATLTAIRYTFLLSLRAPAAVLLGFAIAWLLVRVRIPGRTFIEFGLWVAFFMPVLPVTLGWILLLDPHYGLLNDVTSRLPVLTGKPFNIYSLGGIVWIHMTTTTVPVMVILLLPALRRFDAAFEDSARMCGSGSLRIMRRITLPILAPAIVTALIAGLIRSLEAFEVEQLLGTPAKIQVYATRIYNYISVDPAQYPPAMALSTLFLAVLLVLALVYQRFTGRQQVASVTARGMSLRPVAAASWRYIASAILIGLVCISVIVPVVMLVTGSFMRGFGFFSVDHPYTSEHWLAVFRDPVFVSSAAASLQVGLAVAIGGVALYSLLAYAVDRSRLRGRQAVSFKSWLPWAVPGILLGMSLLWIILSLPFVNVLYGTVGGLILALLVKEMPLSTQMMRTSFLQISEELEQAARICGASWLAAYRRVMLPIVAPMAVSIFMLLLIDSLRDISTTILLASPSARPLPILMMELATSGNLEGAAVVATIISFLAVAIALLARRVGLRLALADE